MTNPSDQPPKLPLIDPTLNVKELVEKNWQFAALLREADNRYNQAMRDAETRRVNDLLRQRAEFDRWKDELLRHQVLELASISAERFSKLEQFRYESSGKGSGATSVMAYVITAISMLIAAGSVAIAIFRH